MQLISHRFIVTTLAALAFTILSSTLQAKTILVFGDSLSAGYKLVQGEGWVELLDIELNKKSKTFKVINASISGETSGGGLSRLPDTLRRARPDIVIVELGANDGLRGYPIKIFKQNLSAIIHLSQQENAQVLLLGMHIPPNYGQRYTQMFYQTYQSLAEEYKIPMVPFFLEGVAANDKLMQEDGLHPNAKGQPFILENVLPHLNPLLED